MLLVFGALILLKRPSFQGDCLLSACQGEGQKFEVPQNTRAAQCFRWFCCGGVHGLKLV